MKNEERQRFKFTNRRQTKNTSKKSDEQKTNNSLHQHNIETRRRATRNPTKNCMGLFSGIPGGLTILFYTL